jgi:hypothetical protein
MEFFIFLRPSAPLPYGKKRARFDVANGIKKVFSFTPHPRHPAPMPLRRNIMIKSESIEKIQAKFSSPRVAVYARPSRMDRFISTAKERKKMYKQEAAPLGCDDVEVYEETEEDSDIFQRLLCDCENEHFDMVILFGLTWFPKWPPCYEKRLSKCGVVECVEACQHRLSHHKRFVVRPCATKA